MNDQPADGEREPHPLNDILEPTEAEAKFLQSLPVAEFPLKRKGPAMNDPAAGEKQRAYELLGGPQDGAKVTGLTLPHGLIWVGPKWMGDGFASWGREHCERFPVCYCHDGAGKYMYASRITENYRSCK